MKGGTGCEVVREARVVHADIHRMPGPSGTGGRMKYHPARACAPVRHFWMAHATIGERMAGSVISLKRAACVWSTVGIKEQMLAIWRYYRLRIVGLSCHHNFSVSCGPHGCVWTHRRPVRGRTNDSGAFQPNPQTIPASSKISIEHVVERWIREVAQNCATPI